MLFLLALLASTLNAAASKPDAIVAADGTGQYTSLQEAISKAPLNTDSAATRWVILVRPGTYHERIYVQRERGQIHVRGEEAATTVITFGLHANLPGEDGKPIGTFRTPTGADGVKTYLGRPWREYARTIFLRTTMSSNVRPEGWHNWNKPAAEQTTFYSEFESTGPGASPAARVPWAKSITAGEAAALTPGKVLGGTDGWDPLKL